MPAEASGLKQGVQHADPDEHRNSNTNESTSQRTPLLIINLNYPESHKESTTNAHAGAEDHSPEWSIAHATWALFGATVALWLFTALLWHTTRRAVVDGEKAIKIAAGTAAAWLDGIRDTGDIIAITPTGKFNGMDRDCLHKPKTT